MEDPPVAGEGTGPDRNRCGWRPAEAGEVWSVCDEYREVQGWSSNWAFHSSKRWLLRTMVTTNSNASAVKERPTPAATSRFERPGVGSSSFEATEAVPRRRLSIRHPDADSVVSAEAPVRPTCRSERYPPRSVNRLRQPTAWPAPRSRVPANRSMRHVLSARHTACRAAPACRR